MHAARGSGKPNRGRSLHLREPYCRLLDAQHFRTRTDLRSGRALPLPKAAALRISLRQLVILQQRTIFFLRRKGKKESAEC